MRTALIAEDEPLLADGLRASLMQVWPELAIVACVGDGDAAVEQVLRWRPDVVFLDIRMPGRSGIEAAADIADGWEQKAGGKPFPALVFVTAYEHYAVQAFEAHAVDYLLKPVQTERLRKTVARLKQLLDRRPDVQGNADGTRDGDMAEQAIAQLRHLLAAAGAQPEPGGLLTMLQASVGPVIHMVPLDAVLLMEAADKYVRVLTADHEYLIRTPLRELLPRLDPRQFWQVHRSHVVQAKAIETVTRDDAGKLWLALRGMPGRIAVSRLYAHRFKAM